MWREENTHLHIHKLAHECRYHTNLPLTYKRIGFSYQKSWTGNAQTYPGLQCKHSTWPLHWGLKQYRYTGQCHPAVKADGKEIFGTIKGLPGWKNNYRFVYGLWIWITTLKPVNRKCPSSGIHFSWNVKENTAWHRNKESLYGYPNCNKKINPQCFNRLGLASKIKDKQIVLYLLKLLILPHLLL